MCSPTWITQKELEREIINKGERISLEEKRKNFIAAVSKWGMLAATKVKMSGGEKEKNQATETHATFPPQNV